MGSGDPQRSWSALDASNERPEVAAYEIPEELGRGADGVVYPARHRELNRQVALKVIMAGPHLAAEVRRRFRVEGQAIARLHHPNIVHVYDVGEQARCLYMALELIEGQNLARWLRGVPLPAGGSPASRPGHVA